MFWEFVLLDFVMCYDDDYYYDKVDMINHKCWCAFFNFIIYIIIWLHHHRVIMLVNQTKYCPFDPVKYLIITLFTALNLNSVQRNAIVSSSSLSVMNNLYTNSVHNNQTLFDDKNRYKLLTIIRLNQTPNFKPKNPVFRSHGSIHTKYKRQLRKERDGKWWFIVFKDINYYHHY